MHYYHLKSLLLIVCISFFSTTLFSQFLNFQLEDADQFPINVSGLTPKADILGRDFLYVACSENGVRIYETSSGLNQISVLSVAQLGLRPMSVNQKDSILYVCIGSHFNSTDPYGIVSVDVSDPYNPVILDQYINSVNGGGTGIVEFQDDYAFVGAMPDGLVILNISDPQNITFISSIVPNIDYPHVNNTQAKVNARGLAVRDSLVYLCYDAGGMRVIDVSDINSPTQIGLFANPITYVPMNLPRAYNNIVLDDTLAYIAVDYCGIEVVNIKDPYNPILVSHWNPHNCPSGQWSNAPIHTNELKLFPECDLLFVSTGKSELQVLNISDPTNLSLADSYGSIVDTTGSWGLDVTSESVFLTYVYISELIIFPFAPFHSNWSGVREINFDSDCINGIADLELEFNSSIFPNPAHSEIEIKNIEIVGQYKISSLAGSISESGIIQPNQKIDISQLYPGYYFIQIVTDEKVLTFKFQKI